MGYNCEAKVMYAINIFKVSIFNKNTWCRLILEGLAVFEEVLAAKIA